jgi:hypothetical protein
VAAFELAKKQFSNDPENAITWALVLAIGQTDEDMRQLLAQEERPLHPADFYLNMVRAAQPAHPVLALLDGLRLARKRQMEQALPLLEIGVGQHPRWPTATSCPRSGLPALPRCRWKKRWLGPSPGPWRALVLRRRRGP